MATVQQMINRALRMIGTLASGESATANEQADALLALNSMLGSWSARGLWVYALTEVSMSFTDGTASYTIGPSGADVTAAKPISIESGFIRISGLDYPLDCKMTKEEYVAEADKSGLESRPYRLLYEPGATMGTISPYPVADQTYAAKLYTEVVLSSFTAVSQDISMPEGYEEAIASNLAIRLAPEYGRPISNEVALVAREALATIKAFNRNRNPIIADVDAASMSRTGGSYNIWSDS